MGGREGDDFDNAGVLELAERAGEVFAVLVDEDIARGAEVVEVHLRGVAEFRHVARARDFPAAQIDQAVDVVHVPVLQQRVGEHLRQRADGYDAEADAVLEQVIEDLYERHVGFGDLPQTLSQVWFTPSNRKQPAQWYGRITYILTQKPKSERALRLRLFRPIPKPLYDDYLAKLKPLDDNYWSRRKPLYDDYEAKHKSLYDDYWSKRKSLYDNYWSRRKSLYDDYLAKLKPLYDDYLAKLKPLDDDYEAKLKPLYDDYRAKLKSLHKKICKVKGCPWNGQTIFPEKS